MALKAQSAKTPVAGPPTTVVRKPLPGIPPFGSPSVAVAPVRLPRGLSMAPLCPIRPRHFVAGPTPNETNETTCRYKTCIFSYDKCLICTLSGYDFCPLVIPSGTKAGHQGPLTISACPSTISLLRWNQPSSTIGRGEMRLPHRRAIGDLLRKDERRKGATSQIELTPEISGHCTKFTEISYEKTRRRYEQSAIHEIQLRSI